MSRLGGTISGTMPRPPGVLCVFFWADTAQAGRGVRHHQEQATWAAGLGRFAPTPCENLLGGVPGTGSLDMEGMAQQENRCASSSVKWLRCYQRVGVLQGTMPNCRQRGRPVLDFVWPPDSVSASVWRVLSELQRFWIKQIKKVPKDSRRIVQPRRDPGPSQ